MKQDRRGRHICFKRCRYTIHRISRYLSTTRGEGLAETYLNQEQILQIAIDTGCDSIHPGFGFLSERADFAQAVMDSGLIWVGPSPDAITKMGDKMTARITMKRWSARYTR